MAAVNESGNIEYWKARCYALENQIFMLYRQNASLSKQIEGNYQERLHFGQIVQRLVNSKIDRNQLVASGSNHDVFFTFPEEVWPFILVYITNSNDLLNLCDASPALDIVLLNKDKPVWLFDKIIPIIFKRLTKTDVLACRLVCRTWKQAIKTYLDSYHQGLYKNYRDLGYHQCPPRTSYRVQEMLQYQLSSHFTPPHWENKLNPTDFGNSTDLSVFLEEMKAYRQANGENLLINRSLKVGLDMANNNDDIHEFWESALNVLHFVGNDVWHMEFYNDGFEEEPASFYSLFQQALFYLPKLKTLRLICDFGNEHYEDVDLITRLGTWSLPCLPYLETLDMLHSIPSPMIATIASSYARQIKKFVVSVSILILLEAEHLRGFHNLSELVIRNCVRNLQEFHEVFNQLKKLMSPNLQKLRLFRSYSEDEVITPANIFGLVVCKFPRLGVLDTYRVKIVEDCDTINSKGEMSSAESGLCVYSIRTLKIKCNLKMSFDFLLKLPCLEELCIRGESEHQNNSERTDHPHQTSYLPDEVQTKVNCAIDIGRFLSQAKIYQSNVWRLIPSLKVLIYESFDEQILASGRYTREMYDYIKK